MIDAPQTDSARNDWQIRLIGLVVICAPLWWVLGLNLFVYHLAALLTFTYLVLETSYGNRRLSIPPVAWLLVAISLIYGFSIALNGRSFGMMRVIAAANNLSYWIMGAMLVVVVAMRFRLRQVPRILGIFPILAVFNVLIALVALVIMRSGVESLRIPTPLAMLTGVLGDTALVEYSVYIRLITADYVSGTNVPRFNLYAPYPTAAGAFFMISIPLLAAWGASTQRLRTVWFWLLMAGQFIGLGMTLARMAVIGMVASAIIVFVLQKRNVFPWAFTLFTGGVLAMPLLMVSADAVVTAREGSSLSRFALYRDSINQLSNVQWVTGRGVRTYSETHRMPFGSHSTYISLLYRTGLAGLGTFVLLQAVLFWRWYRLKETVRNNPTYFNLWRALGMVFISMVMWMVTEDIDVPQLLAFLYFILIGVFEGLRGQLVAATMQIRSQDGWRRVVAIAS